MSLLNKSALVTGACGGIGTGICQEFLGNGVKNLALVDLNPPDPKLLSNWSEKYPEVVIKFYKVDVRISKEIQNSYNDFCKSIHQLDIVINCAGVIDENSFSRAIDINLCGTIGSTYTALEYMNNGGTIVNIASVAGIHPLSIMPTYSASKHAVIAFTRALAHREYPGIRLIALCPGGTDTPLIYQQYETPFFQKMDSEEVSEIMGALKFQSVEIVAKAVLDVINKGINGSVWIIEQGKMTEHHSLPLRL
ncbi:hypothetical protein DMENIID0001_013200 [Sergentomyia squamirostris]